MFFLKLFFMALIAFKSFFCNMFWRNIVHHFYFFCLYISQSQNVLNLFLFFDHLQPRCSYKVCSYKKSVYYKLTVNDHIDYIFNKVNKLIDLLWKLQNFLPSKVFITIFKAFFRPHLDYDNVLCDQGFNNYSYERLELVQFHAWLAITGAIIGTSK